MQPLHLQEPRILLTPSTNHVKIKPLLKKDSSTLQCAQLTALERAHIISSMEGLRETIRKVSLTSFGKQSECLLSLMLKLKCYW